MICRLTMEQRDCFLFMVDTLVDYKLDPCMETEAEYRNAVKEFNRLFANEVPAEDSHAQGT